MSVDLSLLKKDPRNLSKEDISIAYDEIMEIRELIWEEESTLNLRVKFNSFGLEFDNKMSNEQQLELMNQLEQKLCESRVSLRTSQNGGTGYFNENIKYDNGLASELLDEIISSKTDFSVLYDEGRISLSNISIENMHKQIIRLRKLMWYEEAGSFGLTKSAIEANGIVLKENYFDSRELMKRFDQLDLKLMETRKLLETKRLAGDNISYRNGQAIHSMDRALTNVDFENKYDSISIAENAKKIYQLILEEKSEEKDSK